MSKNSFFKRQEIGKKGEEIVEELLIKYNYIPYKASDKISHAFDFLVWNTISEKFFGVEVKYKKPLSSGNVCITMQELTDYRRQKKKYNLTDLFIYFVIPDTNKIIVIEIDRDLPVAVQTFYNKIKKRNDNLVIWNAKMYEKEVI